MPVSGDLLGILKRIEPDADFEGTLPKVRSSAGNVYYVKIGAKNEKEQYTGEATSLKEITAASPGPYMISEYKEFGYLIDKTAIQLGKRLATELHAYKSTKGFGFDVPTFCGATRQPNGWHQSWGECFSALLVNLLNQLKARDCYNELCRKGRLEIEPVLLHGDLWSGNVGQDRSTGEPFIFDPSSYFGHNEADLAIGRIFGGIPQSFFDTYHEYFPKTDPVNEYELRCDLYELYHYLNHTVLFGGGYAESAMKKMNKLLAESDESV
ncbi:Fructosamine/Ketosamine-3-kinase [Amanita rubescens]|nr:Fructosamine/Ketosamine-3-kinase [Amanita rubescens]